MRLNIVASTSSISSTFNTSPTIYFQNNCGKSIVKWVAVLTEQPINNPKNSYSYKWYVDLADGWITNLSFELPNLATLLID